VGRLHQPGCDLQGGEQGGRAVPFVSAAKAVDGLPIG
jgi:hypothetical protein